MTLPTQHSPTSQTCPHNTHDAQTQNNTQLTQAHGTNNRYAISIAHMIHITYTPCLHMLHPQHTHIATIHKHTGTNPFPHRTHSHITSTLIMYNTAMTYSSQHMQCADKTTHTHFTFLWKRNVEGNLEMLAVIFHCCCCCLVASVMSDSVRPHRWQPIRLPCPWDSPGKNTGVGCHFLLQWMKVKSESEVAQLCPTLRDPMDCSLPGSSVHGIF